MEAKRQWRIQPAEVLRQGPVVPVMVIHKLEHAVPLANALLAGGIRVLEITLRTPVACGVHPGPSDARSPTRSSAPAP